MKNKSIEELEVLVEQKNTEAMNELAHRYAIGNGVQKNDEKTAELLKDAVKLGSEKAKYSLAVSYYYGLGVNKDKKIAFDMFKELAEKNENMKVNYYLGEIYYLGNIVETDYTKAFKYITKALEYNRNDKDAKYYFAMMLYYGDGTEKNTGRAIEIFEELYDKFADRLSLLMLVEAYYNIIKNYKKTYEYCNKILENSEKYIKTQNEEERIKLILGNLYYFGQYVEQDYKKALSFYQDISDNKGVISYRIGWINYAGQIGKKNVEESFKYFKKSAEKGYAVGQLMLGQAYLCGEGTEIDEEKAIYWYEKASENGFSLAQYKLGLIYYYGEENGINIKKNSEYAIRLLKKAADSGVEDAKKELQKLQIK